MRNLKNKGMNIIKNLLKEHYQNKLNRNSQKLTKYKLSITNRMNIMNNSLKGYDQKISE
jgi:hypothetical protein